MAVVEDEVRNDSEEENEIEVVVEEDDPEQDSDDSDEDDDAEDEIIEKKVVELEQKIAEDPYNYTAHTELIQNLWGLSELDRWRAAYEHLYQLYALRPDDWLLRLQTEETLAHTSDARDRLADMFQQAMLDCYSIPILSEWCSWLISVSDTNFAREQLEEILHRAGPDPLSGKIFWNAKLELEKSELESLNAIPEADRQKDENWHSQKNRVLWCYEEILSRPLMRAEETLLQLEDFVASNHDGDKEAYLDKIKVKHEIALDYLHKILPFEDKLLITQNVEEKCAIYQEYIDIVKVLAQEEKYTDCDSTGILRVVYDRATSECAASAGAYPLLLRFARDSRALSSRRTYARTLDSCARRCLRKATFWTLKMQQAEHEEKSFDDVKSIFETALSKGMESYKQSEALWLSYLEYTRRRTDFADYSELDRLRRTFRLAWDSLAEAWGEEANDCEVPLYWARLEYKLMNSPKQGKEIFEEIFKYGENKTMSKYWEALIALESNRSPKLSENKLRDLMRRALRAVQDYPPSIARLWTDYERDHGQLHTLRECLDSCEAKIKEWRDSYQAMKDKMIGKKQKGKQTDKKTKSDNKKAKKDDAKENKGKRKSDGNDDGSHVKRKKDEMEVDQESEGSGGVKRSHEDDDDDEDGGDSTKRQRTEGSASPTRLGTRDACTLFVSNLEFKVDEQQLRDKLSQFGDIVSLRVRKGIKAFGGSICYCQYKTPEAVTEALKHDRSPLDGRPMFLSRYSAKKTKPTFKYSTEAEKNKLFVKNLPFSKCNKEALGEIFDKYGKVKDIRIVTHKDGKPKGLAYIEYEDESDASTAVEKTHGMLLCERKLDVALSAPPPRQDGGGGAVPALGLPKRDGSGGMRRTQLSSLIPSVLQRASTSGVTRSAPTLAANTSATNGNHATNSNGDTNNANSNGDKRPLSNSDFRSLLLNKK